LCSGGDGLDGHLVGYLLGGAALDGLASGEDVESEVAASFCTFVVLFSQHGSDEPDERVGVGEDPDDVGASADLPVETFVGPDRGARSPGGTR
jgi:hypothetical protein